MSQGCSRDTSRESSRDTSPARGFTPLGEYRWAESRLDLVSQRESWTDSLYLMLTRASLLLLVLSHSHDAASARLCLCACTDSDTTSPCLEFFFFFFFFKDGISSSSNVHLFLEGLIFFFPKLICIQLSWCLPLLYCGWHRGRRSRSC